MIRPDEATSARGAGSEFGSQTLVSPEEALLAWLVALPEGVDPARAARIALDQIARSGIEASMPARLQDLLVQVALCPPIRWYSTTRRRRRRPNGQ
jgi:hypothetical protein